MIQLSDNQRIGVISRILFHEIYEDLVYELEELRYDDGKEVTNDPESLAAEIIVQAARNEHLAVELNNVTDNFSRRRRFDLFLIEFVEYEVQVNPVFAVHARVIKQDFESFKHAVVVEVRTSASDEPRKVLIAPLRLEGFSEEDTNKELEKKEINL